jgi:uncharacterized damage-inducible protein DinB
MRFTVRLITTLAALLIVAAPASAQDRQGVMGELLKDVTEVENKVVALAKAMPESAWAWKPSAPARSTGEVFLHVAADNYFLPAMIGIAAPAETGITKEYKTAAAFEKKSMGRDAVIAEVQKSFAFLKKSMSETPDAKLDAAVDMFGRKNTNRGVWIMTATHLHEHLGQLIAYARANNVVPPWSK